MELIPLGTSSFPNLPGLTVNTFGYSEGPCCAYGGKMTMRGHIQRDDVAEFTIPQPGQSVSVSRWFDPTFGKLSALQSFYNQTQIHFRGMMRDADGIYGFAQLYYNVSNQWLKTHFFSDAVSVCNAWGKTSVASLLAAGMIFDLPPVMRTAFGKDTGCFECIPQGLAATSNGPSLHLFNRTPSVADNSTVSLTTLFSSTYANPFPEWWGDRELNQGCFTNTHFVIPYRKSFGQRWYGNASKGHLYSERNVTPKPNNNIPSLLNPGQLAVDPCNNTVQGYHAEQFAPFLLVASIDSIITGNPVWEEIDMRPYGLTGKWGRFNAVCDRAAGRLYLVEFRSDTGDRPKMFHFQVLSEQDMQQITDLQNQLAAEQQQLTAKTELVNQLAANVATLESDLAAKTSEAATAIADRDAAQAKIDAAKAALA